MINAFIRANPALFAFIVLFVIAFAVGVILFFLMRHAGSSLRPLVFFYVFFAIVAVPQFLYHLSQVRWPGDVAQTTFAPAVPSANVAGGGAEHDIWAHRDGRFLHPERLFGEDAEPALTREARQLFPDFLSSAEAAEIAMFGTGDTVLAVLFSTPAEAVEAVRGYMSFFHIDMAPGDATQGIRARRGTVGDAAEILLAGNALMVWTAADDAALDLRRHASDLGPGLPSTAPSVSAAAGEEPAVDPLLKNPVFLVFVALNLIVAVAWFFKGAAWASAVPPRPGVQPLPLSALSAHLESIDRLDVPMQVATTADGSEITVDWRYADARWIDHARAHAMRRAHRLVLRLDESSRSARVQEYASALDASAGADGARLQWRAVKGIIFFEKRHERVFGLQFDADGRPKADLTYSYNFDLQELKQPLIQAVTSAGWTWQPVLIDAPSALRWLTE